MTWLLSALAMGWIFRLAYDHGSARPAVCLLIAISPGAEGPDGRYYSRGSLIVIDEMALVQEGTLNVGLRWTVPEIAAEIIRMCDRWGVEPRGVADAAIFAAHGSQAGSLGDEFRRCGVRFSPSRKGDRVHGWQKLARLLKAAGAVDEPAIYIARNCSYLWATLPTLPRDLRRPEDLDTKAADHGADALRYAAVGEVDRRMTIQPLQLRPKRRFR